MGKTLAEPQVLKSIVTILTSQNAPLQTLSSFIPHLSPSLILSVVSSDSLSSRPDTLLSFFLWCRRHVPSPTPSPVPLLFLLRSLFSYNKFSDAKSVLLDFISSDTQNTLHWLILHPSRRLPKTSKALLDTAVAAYVQSGMPHLAHKIFKKMMRLHLRPNLLTCNTLLNALVSGE